MRLLRSAFLFALVLALASADPASAQKGKGKKGRKGFSGKVTEVKKDKDKDTGSLTVQRRKAAPKTFKVTQETRFQKRAGKKSSDAAFTDVKVGQRVTVHHKGDTATR